MRSATLKGNILIGNMHWTQCRLETQASIGNKNVYNKPLKAIWKHTNEIGNRNRTLKIVKRYWKQKV